MKRKYWYGIAGGLILLIFVLYKIFSKDDTLQVAVEEVKKRDVIESVTANGKIFPEVEVKISPESSGELINLYVKEGDKVNKGQIVAVIRSSSSKPIFNFSMPQAGITEAKETVKNVNIYSPINGVVTVINIRKGEKVVGTSQMMGSEIMRIADMNVMKADVNVSENEIQKIKINDTAILKVEAYGNKQFKGIVSRISQSNAGGGALQSIAAMSDQITNYTVSITLLKQSYDSLAQAKNNYMPFRAGMSVSADIQTSRQNQVLTVPFSAVTTREEADTTEADVATTEEEIKEYVFVINEKNEAVQTEVKTDLQDNQYIQITQGLTAGKKVVVAPFSAIARTLKDKMKVKIVSKKELYKNTEKEE